MSMFEDFVRGAIENPKLTDRQKVEWIAYVVEAETSVSKPDDAPVQNKVILEGTSVPNED